LIFGHLTIVKWCSRAGWGRLRRCEDRGLAWRFLIFLLLLKSSSRLWLGTWSRVYFYIICWIMLWIWRFYLMYSEIEICYWDLRIFGNFVIIPLRNFYENQIMYHFWVIEGVAPRTLYLSIDLMLNIACEIWGCYIYH